jgi:4-alpha-glucanotransferase
VLLHPTSLPETGTMAGATRFLDWLHDAGVTVWQMLPVGPAGGDGSPYYAGSSHAGNPRLIDVDALAAAGLIRVTERGSEPYARWHAQQLARAAEELCADRGRDGGAFHDWIERERGWLADHVLHGAIRAQLGERAWWQWPTPLREREASALAQARRDLASALERRSAVEYLFYSQWRALREAAAARGIRLFGDLPMYLAPDAVDVWAHRELFELDAQGQPTAVAGVPPDYFSDDGQLWGNPLYRWSEHRASGYAWWLERIRGQLALFDLLRIDHFRALEAYWAVPAQAATARDGHWLPGPGAGLLEAVIATFGVAPFVAEDLGDITEAVERLRDEFALPGMRVLQFAFDGNADNPHLPHNWPRRAVGYTGTHDNDTAAGWLRGLDASTRADLVEYLGGGPLLPGLIRALLASVAELVVVPMQDLLGLGSEARMNRPGTTGGNWRWRLDWRDVPSELAAGLVAAAARYGRVQRAA